MSRRKPSPLSEALSEARAHHERLNGSPRRVFPDARAEGGVKVELEIPIEDIDPELHVEETLPQGWVERLLDDPVDPPWRAAGDARVDLTLSREAATVRVTGEGSFPLEHACVRCLRDVRFDLDLDFDLRLAEGVPTDLEDDFDAFVGEGVELNGEADLLDPDEADLVPFDGRVVRLPDILREQIFLEVPMHPSCESEGAEPPEGPCTLDPDGALERERSRWQDPRWAGLLALKDRLPPGGDKN